MSVRIHLAALALAMLASAWPIPAVSQAPGPPVLVPLARSTGTAQAPPARLNLLMPTAPAPAETRQILPDPARPVPVGALLGADEQPLAPDGAYAVVLADRGPRSVALCRAMTQALAFTDPARTAQRTGALRPIYWLLALPGAEIATMGELSCEALVERLDLLRAGAAALDGHEGPKLRAIVLRGGSTVVDVLWDLSGQPDTEFRRAIGLWADLMDDDPAGWEARVRQMQLVEDVRGFLINVGEPLSNLLGVRAAAGSAPAHVIRISR